jgi:amidohydrolase
MKQSSWLEDPFVSDDLITDLVATGAELQSRAEPGFRETSTHRCLAGRFESLGFHIEAVESIPGFIARAGASRPAGEKQIAVIADMDGLPDPGGGGYIHSCGHQMQTTALYGAARILSTKKSAALSRLAFLAIPAEEYVDLEGREELRRRGQIRHLSGKQEFLERGLFKDFHRVVSTHAAAFGQPEFISSVLGMGGFEVMRFVFTGRSSHAGAHPHKGINAQNAAALFLQACAFLRESFDEAHHIRIHPILTLPEGQSVNVIPGSAFVETYVRGAAPEAISLTCGKLKAAAEGSALSIGARVDVEVVKGYAPFNADREMHCILEEVVSEMNLPFIQEEYASASSDMGDVSQVLPSIMLGLPGVNGLFHNPDFKVTDEKAAYVLPSVVLARYLERLAAG